MAYAGTNMTSAVGAYYEKRFLMRSEENFVWKQLGTPGRVPKGEGKTVVWNRMTNPSAKTALTEGTDPTPTGLSASLVSATVAQFGNYEQVSDILELTAVDTLVKAVIDVLAYEAALSIDTAVVATVSANGTELLASGVVARSSLVAANTITVADLRKAKRKLDNLCAKPHTKDRFVAVAHPDVIYDLEGDSNWLDAHKYTEKGIDAVYNGEAGELYGTRFIMSQKAPVLTNSGSASAEVYQTFIMGKDFYGVSDLQNLVTYVDSPSPRSALRLYSDIGWKASFAAKVLNNSFGIRYESGATA